MSSKLENMANEWAQRWCVDHQFDDSKDKRVAFKDGFYKAHDCYRPIVEELMTALSIADEALLWSEQMFVARDEMNSKVHCAPVRLSPITERVKQARQALESVRSKI